MKGYIDELGNLIRIEPDRMISQKCPFDNPPEGQDKITCGVWCPLFGEAKETSKGVSLKICQVTIQFEEFKDERISEPVTDNASSSSLSKDEN